MPYDELKRIANELALEHWGVPYTGKFELVNRKWRRMNGCFIFNNKTGEHSIRMSSKVNAERTREEVIGTLLHELVHWRLWSLGLPAHDSDDEFIAECIRVGAPISGSKIAKQAHERYLQRGEEDE